MKRILLLSLVVTLIACGQAAADSITLINGYTATGTILQTNNDNNTVILLRDYGTADFSIPIIKSVKLESDDTVALLPNTNRVPGWKAIALHLSKQSWAKHLKQIPATVIEKGVLQNVPYISFHCGEDYEVNIYGDLDEPAGFEIGVYRNLLTNASAKDSCFRLAEALLSDLGDKRTLGELNREKDTATRNGLTFEVTPPTAEDAYLGWWLSVYDEKRLNRARASEAELKEITLARTSASGKTTAKQENPGWTADEMRLARPAQTYQSRLVPTGSGYAFPRTSTPAPRYTPPDANNYDSGGSSVSNFGGGRVYVRGYTKKDGTYVQPHTRKR